MFRELTRKKQQLSEEECIRLLKTQKRGVLSVVGDGGYPYGMPMNHLYNEEDGKLYFHCGRTGHRMDAIRANDRASFCLLDEGTRTPGEWALNLRSVIVFGRIEIVEDPALTVEITTRLSRKFTEDEAYIQAEIEGNLHRTVLLALTPEHLCGKLVNES